MRKPILINIGIAKDIVARGSDDNAELRKVWCLLDHIEKKEHRIPKHPSILDEPDELPDNIALIFAGTHQAH